jgi:2-oxoglutarate dehydrogenase E2 component (dihydrolipoamide succinyltransferase)
MPVEIKVPELGESITEVQIAEWLVKEGDSLEKDQDTVRLDSEKATVEIPAPEAGTLVNIIKREGSAKVGEVIGRIEAGKSKGGLPETARQKKREETSRPESKKEKQTKRGDDPDKADGRRESEAGDEEAIAAETGPRVMPAAQWLIEEHDLKAEDIEATGPGGRLLKEDVLAFLERRAPSGGTRAQPTPPGGASEAREDELKPLTPLRRTVAKRLVEAQHTMAILTTFNEIDMSAVIALRKQHQEAFLARYQVKIGFMSFFVKAVIEALKEVPQLNAEIRGDDMVVHRYFDIGVAIGAGKGLVVPPLRNAERMSFAEIEKAITDLATRAKESKLKPQELEGGTFTISNGGVYGSMLSTPIINPPQSGILGLHAIQERPVAREGQVVIRPMMFVALSYDHRIVDGREAVTFLRRVKDIIEDPARLMLEV